MLLVDRSPLRLGLLFAMLVVLPLAWADHGAPAPQLDGVTLCLEPSSVQLRLEHVTLAPALREQVRAAILAGLQRSLQSHKVAFEQGCKMSRSYVLLGIYVRFLDPETYVGFPASSYTYVSTAQVGRAVSQATVDTTLNNPIYTVSASDIFQAPSPQLLAERLISLGDAQTEALVMSWLEANTVSLRSYLRFVALGALLMVIALWALSARFR